MAESTCSVDGCEKPRSAKGKCQKHYKAEWHAARRDEAYAKIKARRAVDRERYLAESRAYYQANRDKILARMAEAYAKNPEPKRAASRAWGRANPLRRNEQEMRRRARMRDTQTEPVDYPAILAEYGMFCHICSMVIVDESDLHFDHVIPLVLGGPHTRDNIKPAHALCNIRKGGRVA